jgi:hypothetical protein
MKLVLNIIFSVIMMPVNLYCSFWIFREVLNLSGVTLRGIQNDLAHRLPSVTAGSRYARSGRRNRRNRIIFAYLSEKSSDPPKTKRLFQCYLYSTLPGLAALILAEYTAISQHADKTRIAFWGNIILVIINLVLLIAGKIYRKNNPLDEETTEMLEQARAREREKGGRKVRNIIAYTLLGGVFLTILIGFNLTLADITGAPKQATNRPGGNISHMAVPDSERVRTVLTDRNFETAEIPVSYWFIEEDKLMYVAAGAKDDIKFEFYDYDGTETAAGVFNQIIERISIGLPSAERDQNIAELPGGKMFAMTENGIYSVVIYKGNTVIYAYSPETSSETKDILIELGYIKDKAI